MIVNVEGYGPVEFPDGMSKEEMQEAISRLPSREQNRFEAVEPDTSQSEASKRAERIEYGLYGAGAGAAMSGAQLAGKGAMSAARNLGRATEEGRLFAQRQAGATPFQLSQNAQRILQGTTEEGATGRARMQGFNVETAQQAARAKEAEEIAKRLGLEPKAPLTQAPGLTSTPSGVLTTRTEPGQYLGPRSPQGEIGVTKPARSGLEQVTRTFEGMMQPITRGLQTVGRYVAPPVTLGAAGVDIADIRQQMDLPPEERDLGKIATSGLGVLGGALSLIPRTTIPGMALSALPFIYQNLPKEPAVRQPQRPEPFTGMPPMTP
jgi:hypothetical protein